MNPFPDDIFTEPEDVDPDALANLGPLRPFVGIWQGRKGIDLNPKAEGPERREYIERIVMQPIDPQANGPQLLYGLRYHIHIVASDEDTTFHDQHHRYFKGNYGGYTTIWDRICGTVRPTFEADFEKVTTRPLKPVRPAFAMKQRAEG